MCIILQSKTIRAFLSKGIKLPKHNRWSIELEDYNITFVHITGKKNVLVDTISRLKSLNLYKEPLESPKTSVLSNIQENVMEICVTYMHT